MRPLENHVLQRQKVKKKKNNVSAAAIHIAIGLLHLFPLIPSFLCAAIPPISPTFPTMWARGIFQSSKKKSQREKGMCAENSKTKFVCARTQTAEREKEKEKKVEEEEDNRRNASQSPNARLYTSIRTRTHSHRHTSDIDFNDRSALWPSLSLSLSTWHHPKRTMVPFFPYVFLDFSVGRIPYLWYFSSSSSSKKKVHQPCCCALESQPSRNSWLGKRFSSIMESFDYFLILILILFCLVMCWIQRVFRKFFRVCISLSGWNQLSVLLGEIRHSILFFRSFYN